MKMINCEGIGITGSLLVKYEVDESMNGNIGEIK